MGSRLATEQIDDGARNALARLADELIPAAEGMPAATEVDIAGAQLDAVLRSRPDLVDPLRRAFAHDRDEEAALWLTRLHQIDPVAHGAVILAVVAGYYMHPEVKLRLRYPGQMPQEVNIKGFPEYVDELERVVDRGPIYRPTPSG